VDGETVNRLRAEAKQSDYSSMARLAQALYATGLTAREVLRQCYGVGLPAEVLVIVDADPYSLDTLTVFTNQPWKLAVPPEPGEPLAEADSMAPIERKLVTLDPDLLPLVSLLGHGGESDDDSLILCYRFSELSAGRSTIFDVWRKSKRRSDVQRRGDSLLAVLHEHHTRWLNHLRSEGEQPGSWGADTVDEERIESAREMVAQVEAMRRELVARESG